MKNFSGKTLVVAAATGLVAFNSISKIIKEPQDIIQILTFPVVLYDVEIEAGEMPRLVAPSEHELFLEALGFKESSNDYKAVNKFGYLGKYQFSRTTLNNLGYRNVSTRTFLSDPGLQEQAMEDLLVHNTVILRRYIQKYDGKVVNGIEVTKSGILAAAHLAGPRNVKRWLSTGKEFSDGLGTKLSTYIERFSGYELEL
jgi:hypothetical protein